MCSDPDSSPPIEPETQVPTSIVRTHLVAGDGTHVPVSQVDAPATTGTGILILPDYYGLTPFYERLARRFAEVGIDATVVDYYGRTAEPPPRPTSFDHLVHADGTTWTGLQADAAAAASDLRARRETGSLFSIGFCFGGRTSFLLGTVPELELSGVIGFYGWPVGDFRNDTPAPAEVADRLRAPLLGIFGGADPKIPAADVATFEGALSAAPVEHRITSYADAPHSFFDRKHEGHGEASAVAWQEVRAFIKANSVDPES